MTLWKLMFQRKSVYEPLATRITYNVCGFAFPILDCLQQLEIGKVLRETVTSSKSSVDIWHSNCRLLINRFLTQKRVLTFPSKKPDSPIAIFYSTLDRYSAIFYIPCNLCILSIIRIDIPHLAHFIP